MLPLLPFVAGVAAGVYAAKALRRSDVQDSLRRAAGALREAADITLQQMRSDSAQWRERWNYDGAYADAPDDSDMETPDAVRDGCDECCAEAPRRRRATRRGGRRYSRREESDSGFDTEDDAPAAEAGDEDDASERA